MANYCPLVFMEATGRNRTPDKLPIAEREPLEAACDAHLARLVEVLEPQWLIGVGKFAEARARRVLRRRGRYETTRTGCIPPPLPRQPRRQPRLGRYRHPPTHRPRRVGTGTLSGVTQRRQEPQRRAMDRFDSFGLFRFLCGLLRLGVTLALVDSP